MAEAVRDYGKLALDVIRLVGGKENITSAARCATRLRLVLKDTPEDAEEKIKALPGVITVVQKQGQFQVVIGNHVGDVFEVVSRELKLEEKEGDQPTQKESLLNRLLQMMSGVFAPICYILAAGGADPGRSDHCKHAGALSGRDWCLSDFRYDKLDAFYLPAGADRYHRFQTF